MKNQLLTILALALFSTALVLSLLSQSFIKPTVRVIACDVGQGDASLVLYGSIVILIDLGPDSSVMECLQANIPVTRPTIDLLVLTHDDSDHIGGFDDVVLKYTIKKVSVNPSFKNTKSAESVRSWLEELPERAHHPAYGNSYIFPGLRLSVVWSERRIDAPGEIARQEQGSNENSIALYLESEGFGFLEAGDLGCSQELAMSGSTLLKKVHLLKMSHHGSKTSSCSEYVDKIRPEAAYYSAGKGNTYGHPDPLSLESIQAVTSFVRGTDQIGNINFAWKHNRLFIEGEN